MSETDRWNDFPVGVIGHDRAGIKGKKFKQAADCRSRVVPSFLVVGPPRTGTTWLYEVLSGHVNLPYPTKETRFFDLHFHRGVDWYLSHFLPGEIGRATGEVAPTYFAAPEAVSRIAKVLPEVKVVFIFRQPVERIVSLYRLKRAYGMLRWSLDEALECDPELLGTSRYATHLQRWRESFPQENLSVYFYEDLRRNPQDFVNGLADDLAIPRFPVADVDSAGAGTFSSRQMTEPRSYMATRAARMAADWCKARRLDAMVVTARKSPLSRLFLGGGMPFQQVPASTLERIAEMVRPEVERLERMVGRDLSDWKRIPVSE